VCALSKAARKPGRNSRAHPRTDPGAPRDPLQHSLTAASRYEIKSTGSAGLFGAPVETCCHLAASYKNMRSEFLAVVVAILSLDYVALGQQPASGTPPQPEGKRIFGIIPNYRTSPSLAEYEPLTPKKKFMVATQDSFDRGTVVLAAAFAGEGQLTNANRSFGQGTAGYARYFGTAYADLVIGDYMTEAIYPTILHQDPRYFRRGTGSGWSRFGYAVGQIFWTHADTSRGQFNFSEILGNSTAVAISNAYYQDNRDPANAVSKLGIQIGVDMAGNVLKEFWPDLDRKLFRRHHASYRDGRDPGVAANSAEPKAP